MKFGTILADPPWSYRKGNAVHGAVDAQYLTADTNWIKSLPVPQLAARDCTLLLWATNPKMPDAFGVLESWGFDYKTMITWVKMSRAAAPRVGIGYHARGATEHLLIGSRGNAPCPFASERPLSVIFCPRGTHSAKPDYQYDLAENYAGPYLELFHRPRDGGLFGGRPGWTFLGNAVDGREIGEALLEFTHRR